MNFQRPCKLYYEHSDCSIGGIKITFLYVHCINHTNLRVAIIVIKIITLTCYKLCFV